MNDSILTERLSRLFLCFCLLHFAFCISGCSRAPQTAADLLAQLPRRYGGELRLQGETGTRTLAVELLDLKVRDSHHVEFGRLAYEVTGEGKGEAAIKGTISAPGGEITIDDASGAGGDALKPGTFHGTLASDLRTVEAKWRTGFDQSVRFDGKAAR